MLFNNSFGVQGKIVAVEENWIKIDEKNRILIINGDMIQDNQPYQKISKIITNEFVKSNEN